MIKIKNRKIPRFGEFKLLFIRIGLAYVFYFLARALFYLYNRDLIEVSSLFEFLKLAWHGLAFDTTAILYINSLFILLSVLPLYVNTKASYQKFLMWLYFITNLTAYATNFIDFIYYRFNFGRSTIAMTESVAHESNKMLLFGNFLVRYWHVFLLFIGLSYLWIYLYKKRKLAFEKVNDHIKYWLTSVLGLLLIAALAIGGIRGDFKKSTRPINLVDANRYVTNIAQADVVLNTPFAIIRTLNVKSIYKVNYVSNDVIAREIKPIKHYANNPETKPNIVIFILESYGREYISSFNKNKNIPGYKGYSPFVDSLAQHSLIFTNGYANGYKSIHGMSSVLAGIPSFKDAFTSSPYAKQDIESLVSILKGEGYTTSFYHGAPNGSMGFLGFGNILGFDHYYGKTEYNNDADFDGVWGIWDEPFFQYFNKNLGKEKQPFFATLFTVSSHEPYKVPEKYKGKFPKGNVNIHEPIGYTDYALKEFFNAAKKQPWFDNTIFVLVADHGNTIYYDEYKKIFNKNTVPILFYSPSGKYVGVNDDFAQQIDIYPTLLDMIGYKKPFRSWGRSLVGEKDIAPFVVRYSANMYQFMGGNYICTFDGRKVTGFYAKDDKGMTKNLIGHRNAEMDILELRLKAFLQDYMQRIIDKKLTSKK
jgi:phosphoglycerol transferase MdoB-like AlkP superfamily enzyme